MMIVGSATALATRRNSSYLASSLSILFIRMLLGTRRSVDQIGGNLLGYMAETKIQNSVSDHVSDHLWISGCRNHLPARRTFGLNRLQQNRGIWPVRKDSTVRSALCDLNVVTGNDF